MKKITIITPTYNEEGTVVRCLLEVEKLFTDTLKEIDYEHIVIDNFSTDATVPLIRSQMLKSKNIKLIVNSRNIGASKSIYKAMRRATGDWVVPMLAADLQDPVLSIKHMYEKAKDSNANVVFGIRTNRKESFLLTSLRTIYYKLLQKISEYELPIHAGDFALINRSTLETILSLDDKNPYIRGLISQYGQSFEYHEYVWEERLAGKSKSSPLVLLDVAISGMISMSRIPARISLVTGFLFSFLSLLLASIFAIVTLTSNIRLFSGIPAVIVTLFFTSGIQLFFLGLVGEYVLSIHTDIRERSEVSSLIEENF